MELPLAALGCKLSGYVPEVPPGQMQRRGAATHGQTCFAPNRYTIFWRPPYAWHGGDANRRSDPDGGCCRCGKGRATVGSMQGAMVSPASMQVLYCDVM